MADLFGNRGFWQDSGCLSTEKKEGKTEDSDLVLICFQISVWSGTTTEQTSIEEGAEFMKRRRIIPGVMLKPFLDFRARAKALCQEMGEPYLNGFVMRRQDAAVAERALSVWRKEFCRWRDEVFAPAYEDILAQRLEGIIPPGCSKEAVFPPTNFVLRRISFEFDAFVLAAHGTGKRSSKDAFLDGLAERFADETDLICGALEPTSRKRLCVGLGRFMNGYVHGAVLKLDLLLLPLHWKKRLPKAAGPMSGAEAKSFLLSVWIKLGKHLRKQVLLMSRTRRKRQSLSYPFLQLRKGERCLPERQA